MKTCSLILLVSLAGMMGVTPTPAHAADFPVSCRGSGENAPAAAYNSQMQEYLVVWIEETMPGNMTGSLLGQRFNEDGTPVGNPITLATEVEGRPDLVYNSKRNEYLVVYVTGTGMPCVSACRLTPMGYPAADPAAILASFTHPTLAYNSLSDGYLVIAQMLNVGPVLTPGDYFSFAYTAELAVTSPGYNVSAGQYGDYSRVRIAYAPLATTETPGGRYLVSRFTGSFLMLDSDGKPLNTLVNPATGASMPGVPVNIGNGEGKYDVDIAYGDTAVAGGEGKVFLVVYADNKDAAFPGTTRTGIYGTYVDATRLVYTAGDPFPDNSFPIYASLDHQTAPKYADTWKPKAAFNPVAREFYVVWRETPGPSQTELDPGNQIMATNGFRSGVPPWLVTISTVHGTEDPAFPVIAASTGNQGSLVVWVDDRNDALNSTDIYGTLFRTGHLKNTPVGDNVAVTVRSGIQVRFGEVTTTGYTKAATTLGGPPLPGGYASMPLICQGRYAEFTTTAAFRGRVTVGLRYALERGAHPQRDRIRMMGFDTADGHWRDITMVGDTAFNTVYGTMEYLSTYAVALADSRDAVDVHHTGMPAAFSLSQNYPNPFNPATTIRYEVPVRVHVTLSIFSLLGQRVAELANADVEAGSHEIRFNARGLPSGVYYYRLRAGRYVQTRVLCLTR